MADLAITAANVKVGASARTRTGIAGATITRGQVVYQDSSDLKFKLADANLSSTAAAAVGIALQDVADGQPLTIVEEDDDFTVGGTLDLTAIGAAGLYVLSGTAGGIAPAGDIAAGWYIVPLLVAKSATKAILRITRGTAAAT